MHKPFIKNELNFRRREVFLLLLQGDQTKYTHISQKAVTKKKETYFLTHTLPFSLRFV